ncbi:response regulator [Flavobacterium sp. Sd200]|uniref:LytR/AlgR family response regulator transcription factor n=1 Tax=Flavobacterium sp. Sd200 TaxID=2692211 RepID=UPI00136A72D2|nr:response regulator transcription factor [Flavobacterium sp. Sd200]MXN92347.1 response regulator [Flavobacterium sp. Sd200]
MPIRSILIVEDDFLNRRLLKKVLLENGYNVLEAKNSKEALEVLKKESVVFIVLDINLGVNEQDGISLGQQIKDKFSIPFIYLTAYENQEIIERAVSTSPYSYLTKPFKNSDLIAAIEIAIRHSANFLKQKPFIHVKEGDLNVKLEQGKINYIVSEGNYLLFYTDEKVYKTRSTIKNILNELSDSMFIQTHRAYVVNKSKIEKFSNKSLVIGNASIPISENYLEEVKQFL